MILIERRDQIQLCFLKKNNFSVLGSSGTEGGTGEQLSNDKLFVIYCSYWMLMGAIIYLRYFFKFLSLLFLSLGLLIGASGFQDLILPQSVRDLLMLTFQRAGTQFHKKTHCILELSR
jgi:hypothetical protein